MEELKLLVEMVASLPSLAVWVVAAFYIYKISIIGSIYGVIRFVTQRVYEWAVSEKRNRLIVERKEVHLEDILNGICISSDDTKRLLIFQLKRVAKSNAYYKSAYIHESTVGWLAEAIDMKITADNLAAKK